MKLYDMPRIPLRLFMGLQMSLHGVAVCSSGWADRQTGLWCVLVVLAGLVLVIPCAVDCVACWYGRHHYTRRATVSRFIRASRRWGYLLSGAIWGGYGYLTLFDGQTTALDLQAPVYVLALAWVSFDDAYRTREVTLGHERRFPQSVLH